MSFLYNAGTTAIADGTVDLLTDSIRARLVMTNTTCDTQNDGMVNLNDFTTPDYGDATGASNQVLGTKAVTKEDASDRAIFTSASVVFSGMSGDATRNYQGMILYEHVDGTDANDLVLAYIEFSAPVVKEATQVTVSCPAAGWLTFTNTGTPA